MMSLRSLPLALALLFVASGCAVGTRLTAGHEDYRLYRETHLAATVEERLAAGNSYLNAMPDGKWRKEVRSWFKPSESAYFQAAQNSLPRLRAYIQAMPDGPHAKEAQARIVELETEIAFAARREQRTLSSARAVQEKFSSAAEQRQALTQGVADWVRLLASIDSFGQPTSALPHELIYRFRLEAPPGACQGDRCKKSLAFAYSIPEQGKLVERVALFDIIFELDGGVRRALLSGPELFSRLGEALELRAVELAHPQSRVEAIGRMLPVLENALESRLPQATCARAAVSPTLLERACSGLRVTVIAGEGGEDEDRIVFEPSEAAAAP
ncbi:MAG TPA: hypothetical protein VM686_39435 [Polyangiaceae bacterium]|jgi:hypothetical protein|nr:hypothetical protein [Polyangiaceae bacterium]